MPEIRPLRTPAAPATPPETSVLVLVLNWLFPGVGWLMCGRVARGLITAGLVLVTFILGLMLHGGVSWPSWNPRSEAFNLINNFTFIIQLGAGVPSMISLLADRYQFTPLGGTPEHAYYELGGYYMVVAGAINYFATCNLYDRLMRTQGKYAAQEGRAPVEGTAVASVGAGSAGGAASAPPEERA